MLGRLKNQRTTLGLPSRESERVESSDPESGLQGTANAAAVSQAAQSALRRIGQDRPKFKNARSSIEKAVKATVSRDHLVQSVMASVYILASRSRLLLTSVLFFGLFATAPAALAQTSVKLVGNVDISQTSTYKVNYDAAQNFYVPASTRKWRVTSVEWDLRINSGPQPDYSVEIWTKGGYFPDEKLHTFQDKKDSSGSPTPLTTGKNKFEPNGEFYLNPGRGYSLVYDTGGINSENTDSVRLRATTEKGEDSNGQSGWTIDNDAAFSNPNHPGFDTTQGYLIWKVAVYGYQVNAQQPTVSLLPKYANDLAVHPANSNLALTANGEDPDGGGAPTYSWQVFQHVNDGNGNIRLVTVTDSVLSSKNGSRTNFNSSSWGFFTVRVNITDDEGASTNDSLNIIATTPETSDSTLRALELANADGTSLTLTPAFDPAVTSYTTTLDHPTSANLDVTATLSQDIASFATFGVFRSNVQVESVDSPTSGTKERLTSLTTGDNTVRIEISSADTTSATTYDVVVTRPTLDPVVTVSLDDSDQDAVDIGTDVNITGTGYDPDGGDVTFAWKAFDDDGNDVTSTVLTVNASDDKKVTFNSSTWGHFTVRLIVTDDENSSENAQVTITARSTASKDATLSALVVADTEGTALTLTPTFASGTTEYTVDLTEIELDPLGLDLLVTATLSQSDGFFGMIMERSDGTQDVPTNPTSGTQERLSALTPGENVVTVETQSPDGLTRSEYDVTVTANPLPVVSVTPSDPTVGTGSDLTLRASATDMIPAGGNLTYAWIAVDQDASNVTDSVLTVGTDTKVATFSKTLDVSDVNETYWVTVSVTDEKGGVGRDTTMITVSPNLPPVVTVSPSGPVTLDAGKDLSLAGSATDPDGDPLTNYVWTASDSSGNDVTATALSGADTANATFNTTTLGTYTVTLTVTDSGGASSSQSVTVTVMSPLVLSTTAISVPEDGGTGTWMVRLREAPTSAVTVSLSNSDTNVAGVSPLSLTFTASSWNVNQTVTAAGVNDNVPNATSRQSIVTHTVSGADYTNATNPTDVVTVTTVDDDIPGMKLSQTALSVDEDGGTGTWTVVLNTQPSAAVTVTLANSTPAVATIVPATSLTFTTENWNIDQTVTATGVDDSFDNETARTTTVTHTASGADYGSVTAQTVTVTLNDDDARGVSIEPTALTIVEGNQASFRIRLQSQPNASGTNPQVTVSGVVTRTSGTRTLTPNNFSQQFSLANWEDGEEVLLMVEADDTPTEDDTVYTVTLTVSGADYDSVIAETVVVTIPGLSVSTSEEGEEVVTFSVPDNGVVMVPEGTMLEPGIELQFTQGEETPTITMSPEELSDEMPSGFRAGDTAVNIDIPPGTELSGPVTICLPREGGGRVFRWNEESLEWEALELPPDDFIPPGPDYACGVTPGFSLFATGSVQSSGVAAARLAQLGRVMAGQVVDAVQNRLAASREAGFRATMAGQALPSFGESSTIPAYASTPRDGLNAELTGTRDWENTKIQQLTERSFLSGSSFSLTDKFQGADSVSFWGQASITGFEGEGLEDGRITSGFLGADWASDQLTAGLALSLSRGKGTWTSDDEGEKFESSLTGIHPYFSYELSNRMSVWGVAGYGSGDIETTDGSTDMDMLMLAGGTSGDLESPAFIPGNASLSLQSDVLLVRLGTEEEDTSASRLRVAAETSWQLTAENGSELKPTVEVGLRLDGGDAETGFGIDFGGGIGWRDTESGTSAQLRGRVLLTHESNDLRERSIFGSFGWDPNPSSAEGSNLTLSYTVGDSTTGGVKELFSRNTLNSVESIVDDFDSHRMEIRLGYGMPVLGGRFIGTPQTAFGYSDNDRDVSLGLRMTLVDRSSVSGTGSVDLSVEARRSESVSNGHKPEDEFVLRLRSQF